MLDALRRGAAGWVAKALMGLLIISFAVWGVADVFRGGSQGSLARVGGTEISEDMYRQAYEAEVDALSRRFQRRLTPEQARMFGVEARALSRVIGSAAVEAHARELDLTLSDGAIAEGVVRDPMFQGPDGLFSRAAVESIRRQLGMNEREFIEARRKDEVREFVTEALLRGVETPSALVELMHKFREETRSVTHFTIDATKAVALAEPSEANLKETYDANLKTFVRPEYRKLSVLLLTPERMKQKVNIADGEVAAAYEQDRGRYRTPERRRVQQIAFKDLATAEAAAQAIAGGQSFADAAKATGAAESDVDLGLVSRSDLIDPKVAEAAFALPKDGVSTPVQGTFATVLVKVVEIEPAKERPLDEVKGEIRERLAAAQASQGVQKAHDQIDDLRLEGKTLKEIAQTLDLEMIEVPETDRTGKTAAGTLAMDRSDAQSIVVSAFETSAGADREALNLPLGGYAWIDVLGITPEQQKDFAEVKADVEALWRKTEQREGVSALAAKLVERAGKGEGMDVLAAEAGGSVTVSPSIRRTGQVESLPENAIQQAFAVAKDAAASAETSDGNSRIVLKVTDITLPPPPDAAQTERMAADLTRQRQEEILTQYIAALQQRYGVNINQAAMQRISSPAAQ